MQSLKNPHLLIKYILQSGWSIWISTVWVFNLIDLYFKSGNFKLLEKTTSVYHVPEVANLLLFGGIIIWQFVITFLFWLGLFSFIKKGYIGNKILIGYAASLALWLLFMIADEIFRVYQFEATHMRIFIAQLLSLIFIIYTPARKDLNETKSKK